MYKPLISVGCCDGISCIQPSFAAAGITNYIHISIERDEMARKVVAHNYPGTRFFDDVRNVTGKDLGWVDFFSAGTSCKNLSEAGSKKGLSTTLGIPILTLEEYEYYKKLGHKFTESCITFFETIRIFRELREINPDIIYLFENVVNTEWEAVMSEAIGDVPTPINSKYFIGQNRNRNYWFNLDIQDFDKVTHLLSETIPGAVTGVGYRRRDYDWGYEYNYMTKRRDNVANCITTWPSYEKCLGTRFYINNQNVILPFTIEDLERLQGLPVGYTNVPGLTEMDRIRMIGNGWTIPVIAHILKSYNMVLA